MIPADEAPGAGPRRTAVSESIVILSDRCYQGEYGSMYIVGELKNEGNVTARLVEVHVRLYDENGEMVETDSTLSDPSTVSPGATASFKIVIMETEVIRKTKKYRLFVDAM